MKNMQASVRVLSQDEIELIHQESTAILDSVGMQLPNSEALALLKKQGCRIDGEIARFPREVVERALANRRAGDEPSERNTLGELTGSVSTEVYLIDLARRTRRPGTLDDIRKGIALTERLSHFPAPDAIVLPSDVPTQYADLMAFYTMFVYARKPGGTYLVNEAMAEPILDMAFAMNRKVGFLLDTVSPLRVNADSLRIALRFAKRGMPLSFASLATAMTSAPVTAAGALTLQNAEYLAGIVILDALGASHAYYPGMVHPADPTTLMCSFGSPFIARTSVACAQMANFYGLTPYGNIGLTDSLFPDFQAGFEKALSATLGSCAGVRQIGCQGIVGADQGNSFEQLVLDEEWLTAYGSAVQGVEVTRETIARDMIEQLGIGGFYCDQEHTLEHFRQELLRPPLFSCAPWSDDAPSLLVRAREKVEAYTEGYRDRPSVLPDGLRQTLDRIVRDATRGEIPIE